MRLRYFGKALAVFIILLASIVLVSGAETPVQGLPSSITKFLSNERINVYAVGPDNAATVTGFIVGEGMNIDVKEGGVSNPTVNIFMTNRISKRLEEAEEPLGIIKEALATGEMKIQGVGVKSGVKVSGFLEAFKRLAPETAQALPKEASPDVSLSDSVLSISKKTAQGGYAIEKGDKLKHHSIDGLDSKYAAKKIIVKEYSGLKYNEIPQGTKNLPFSGKEESLGKFIDLQLPEGSGQAVIKFYYTKDELYSKSIKEEELKVKWYDESSGTWITLKSGAPSWVSELGIDKEKGFAWIKVSHASVYGIGGAVVAQVPERITVRQPEPAALETPTQPQQQPAVIEISTESPNWLARVAGIIFVLLALMIALVIKRRQKKDSKDKEKMENP